MRTLSLLCLLCICGCGLSAEKSIQLRTDEYPGTSLAYVVQEVQSGELLAEMNSGQASVPASVGKLLTTGAALEMLGPEKRFKTELAYRGLLEKGSLKGDLYILGGGDPSLGSEYTEEQPDSFLQNWVQAVKQLGISCIEGDIIADASIFDEEAVSPYWLWEDLGNYYAAGVYGLAVFDNMFRLGLKSGLPGTKPDILYLKPVLPDMQIINNLTTKENTKDSAYFYGIPYSWERVLYGSVPAGKEEFIIRGDIPDPPAYLAFRLQQELIKAGISIQGKVCTKNKPGFVREPLVFDSSNNPLIVKAAVVLYTRYSKPLGELVKIINYHSHNLYTEYLLRHLALAAGAKAPVSARAGLEVLQRFWAQKGVDISTWQLYDASGLSPLNRVDAAGLAAVLRYMALESPQADLFFNSLPQAALEGTVVNFGKKLPGTLRIKSGSMKSVTAYAGYLQLKDKTYVVVLLCNQYKQPAARIRTEMEQVLKTIYNKRLK
ncbi:MAG: D-alanyl-D-alanine carboxypeptidase/D-alanyl-D-alanine-endopeptidase [Bacteroidales bacterium]|nr:D-alanyl-D-alanine carboxypeptidase/D-alanyl-D-alanine-endopeptidase [Bacteroidales bacterium]